MEECFETCRVMVAWTRCSVRIVSLRVHRFRKSQQMEKGKFKIAELKPVPGKLCLYCSLENWSIVLVGLRYNGL